MPPIIHGHARAGKLSPTHNAWSAMWQRCINPKNKAYPNYGGRGITACQRWASFENFLADMGPAQPGLTLERKNNDEGYSPENCLWATRSAQRLNQRERGTGLHGQRRAKFNALFVKVFNNGPL